MSATTESFTATVALMREVWTQGTKAKEPLFLDEDDLSEVFDEYSGMSVDKEAFERELALFDGDEDKTALFIGMREANDIKKETVDLSPPSSPE